MTPSAVGLDPVEVPLRIVVAGHDLRFISDVVAALRRRGHAVAVERWQGHDGHDEEVSARLADWAQVVICEWCLGNAVWYAANKRPGQRLLVRFHRFELDKPFAAEIDADAVDHWLFAGPHFLRTAAQRFSWPQERCVYLPNYVDVARTDRPKGQDARFTLGVLVYHRRLKRLDLALDLLEHLRADDRRFRLTAKGRTPREVGWVWRYEDERRYFEEQYARIEDSEHLRGAVDFEPYDDQVPEWLSRVGYILSLSDLESFHLAAAEGMASGAVPILRRREGVEELYPERWIFAATDAMAAFIAGLDDDAWAAEGRRAQEFIRTTYGLEAVSRAWTAVVRGVGTDLVDRASVLDPP